MKSCQTFLLIWYKCENIDKKNQKSYNLCRMVALKWRIDELLSRKKSQFLFNRHLVHWYEYIKHFCWPLSRIFYFNPLAFYAILLFITTSPAHKICKHKMKRYFSNKSTQTIVTLISMNMNTESQTLITVIEKTRQFVVVNTE